MLVVRQLRAQIVVPRGRIEARDGLLEQLRELFVHAAEETRKQGADRDLKLVGADQVVELELQVAARSQAFLLFVGEGLILFDERADHGFDQLVKAVLDRDRLLLVPEVVVLIVEVGSEQIAHGGILLRHGIAAAADGLDQRGDTRGQLRGILALGVVGLARF